MNYYENQNYYDILGVSKDASSENISKAKDRLYYGERVPFFMWDRINEAYRILSNPEKRREYDKILEENKHSRNFTQETNVENSQVGVEGAFNEEISIDPEATNQSEEVTNSVPEPADQTEGATNTELEVANQPEEATNTEPESANQPEEVTNNDSEEEIDNPLSFNGLLNDNKKRQKNKLVEKLKTASKYTGVGLAGFSFLGPIGSFFAIKWYKKHRKTKLQRDPKEKTIKYISTDELKEVEKYNEILNKQIDKLLSEPHSSYRLEINRLKYENMIKLLESILIMRISVSINKPTLSNKMGIVSIKQQLDKAKKELDNINKKIENYEGNSKLSKINSELLENSKNIIETTRQKKDNDQSISVKNLIIRQNLLLRERNKRAQKQKDKLIKNKEVYNGLLKNHRIKSFPPALKRKDKFIEYIISDETKQRSR